MILAAALVFTITVNLEGELNLKQEGLAPVKMEDVTCIANGPESFSYDVENETFTCHQGAGLPFVSGDGVEQYLYFVGQGTLAASAKVYLEPDLIQPITSYVFDIDGEFYRQWSVFGQDFCKTEVFSDVDNGLITQRFDNAVPGILYKMTAGVDGECLHHTSFIETGSYYRN
ncbi:MAG: hypothetical protein KAS32_07225 [Candidatus Peribacteraceae bacterium]|nr:hypothetical protein [Candidatus Peribacteraceae bacterium]